MISTSPAVPVAEFEQATGWELKPEGACRGPVCIPLGFERGTEVNLEQMAKALAMPLVHDAEAGLWALGPGAGAVLESAAAPDFSLPAHAGGEVSLRSLRGSKVLVVAWAPW